MEDLFILCAYLASPLRVCQRVLETRSSSTGGSLTYKAPATCLSTCLIPVTDSCNFWVSCLSLILKVVTKFPEEM